ncbi:hypothetical protein L9F63_010402, partial [Diploptera punctata]
NHNSQSMRNYEMRLLIDLSHHQLFSVFRKNNSFHYVWNEYPTGVLAKFMVL